MKTTIKDVVDQIIAGVSSIFRTSRLFHMKDVELDEVDGSDLLVNANDLFAHIDQDLRAQEFSKTGSWRGKMFAAVYAIRCGSTFAQIFGSLSSDLNKLCLTQAQIINFVKKYNIERCGGSTFFLFKSGGHFFIAGRYRYSFSEYSLNVYRLGDEHVWNPGYKSYRVVVPRISSSSEIREALSYTMNMLMITGALLFGINFAGINPGWFLLFWPLAVAFKMLLEREDE